MTNCPLSQAVGWVKEHSLRWLQGRPPFCMQGMWACTEHSCTRHPYSRLHSCRSLHRDTVSNMTLYICSASPTEVGEEYRGVLLSLVEDSDHVSTQCTNHKLHLHLHPTHMYSFGSPCASTAFTQARCTGNFASYRLSDDVDGEPHYQH